MIPGWLGGAGGAWLAAALVLGIAELAVPGVFLVFLAVAAAITGVAVLVLGEVPAAIQLASFAAWSVVAVLVGRRWYRDYPVATADALLNDRAARLIGGIARLETAIVDGRGRAIVGDGTWPVKGPEKGPDLPAGATVRIVAVEGATLVVEGM